MSFKRSRKLKTQSMPQWLHRNKQHLLKCLACRSHQLGIASRWKRNHALFHVMSGEARHLWEHSIPPVQKIRSSITFQAKETGSGAPENSLMLMLGSSPWLFLAAQVLLSNGRDVNQEAIAFCSATILVQTRAVFLSPT